ncbi:histidinol-phosphate aminotransferase [Desulfomicrobium norvegicum]|uniref:Histidinol-phosphate aminotransferase n=1 Tax=Desulfomicrobium norvegicum (strain DSM 1741 / NCIMB 8310) TaxID=52561 RepID=A0A8G2C5G9_DESNO|nr:histidinol-phosphate aminotransferase [Desulfomicrobium norvegicum]
MTKVLVRPEMEGFKPYSPGLSIDEIKKRYGLPRVIKMASNENPLGTSPVVQERLRNVSPLAFRYAQAGSPALTEALAAHLGVSASCVVAGNGSDEIIDLLLRVVARPGVDNVVAFRPCFSIYDVQSRLCGVEFRQARLNADFSFPFDTLLSLVDENTALVFVTNPDNPSGHACPASDLVELAARLPKRALLVVDEAYVDFAEPLEAFSMLPHLGEIPNLVVLRTFSKMYGLAGLRLGYGVMPEWLADLLLRVKLPFSVNILAEQAGLAALDDDIFVSQTLLVVSEGRRLLERELSAMGCKVWPSQANFLMFEPPMDARTLFEALLAKGVIIRPLGSYGMPEKLRVSIGNEEENLEFLAKTAEVLRDHDRHS